MQQAGVEEIDTKGVFVNSVEVAPSEILTKEEINDIVRPLVGRNVFIEDIQKLLTQSITCMLKKDLLQQELFCLNKPFKTEIFI